MRDLVAPEAPSPPEPPAAGMPLPAGAAPTGPRRAGRLWTTRGLWLGAVAYITALAGTLLLWPDAARASGVGLIVVAALLAAVAWSGWVLAPGIGPRPDGLPMGGERRRVLAVAGVGIAGLLALAADAQFLGHPQETFGLAGVLWVGGMILLVIAAATWPGPAPAAARMRVPRLRLSRAQVAEALAVAGLLALALVVRTWALGDLPYAIHPDEIETGRVAAQGYLQGPGAPVFSTLWADINLPALWFAGVAAAVNLGGHTLAALRLPAALFGAATILPFYGMVRAGWGRAAALGGTFLLATGAVAIQYSRVTINNIVTPFFWAACFCFLLRGLQTRRPRDWVLAGLAAGLSEYGYYGTHLLPFILSAFAGYLLVLHGRAALRLLGLWGLTVLAYLVAFGPLLAYYSGHPDLYFGRGAGVLTWDHIPRDWADWARMWDTLWPLFAQNLLGLSTQPDQSSVYAAPLLLPAQGALLVLGVALLLRQWRRPAAFLMLLSGLGVLFVGGTLVHGTPFIAHWTPAFPAFYAALAVPIGAWAAAIPARAWPRAFRGPRPAHLLPGLLAAGILLAGALDVDFYFQYYQVTRPEFEIRAAADRWAAALGPDYRVRMVGRTWQPYDAEALSYLLPGQDGGTLYNPAAELPLPGQAGRGLAFAFFADDEQYLPLVQDLYPGGAAGAVQSHGGVHLFDTYVLAPAAAAARYGVWLEVQGRAGNAEQWRGQVPAFGAQPRGLTGSVRATWSAGLYVPAAASYRLDVAGGQATLQLDGRPIALPAALPLGAGWHRVVLSADMLGPAALALQLGADDAPAAAPAAGTLWPWPATTGLLGAVAAPADGAPPIPRVDPFLGFTAAGDPAVAGPAQQAVPVRARWTGDLLTSPAGGYQIELRTDGQARLAIDGRPLIVACGAADAAPVGARLALAAGAHRLQLDYLAAPGNTYLELYWTPPGGARSLIPPEALRYAADAAAMPRLLPPPVAVDCSAISGPGSGD